jgi:ABC-2 type transport system permease protein
MSAAAEQAAPARTLPLIWSVRRELWENRYLYIAPIAVAVLVLFAFVVGTVHLPQILSSNVQKPGSSAPPPGLPYSIAGIAIILTGILVGAFYCIGALYNERRDRSILFWKSLPVSDTITILSKAAIPLLVLPAIIFAIAIAMQIVMFLLTYTIVLFNGESIPAFWTQWPLPRMILVLAYGLVTLSLWQAPLYAWLLMVSAWAKRAPFLWAVLPPIALCLGERIAFDSSFFGDMLATRLCGSFNAAFNGLGQDPGPIRLSQLAPLQFLTTPALWSGLAFTIAVLAIAIRLRRYRGQL